MPALDRPPHHVRVGDAAAAERDIGHLDAGAAERAVAAHGRPEPLVALVRGVRLGVAEQKEIGGVPPGGVPGGGGTAADRDGRGAFQQLAARDLVRAVVRHGTSELDVSLSAAGALTSPNRRGRGGSCC
jgi:hypothetical protein